MEDLETLLEKRIDAAKLLIAKRFTNFLILIKKIEKEWKVFPALQIDVFDTTIVIINSFNPKLLLSRNIPKRKLQILEHFLNIKNRNFIKQIDFLFENQHTKMVVKDDYIQREIKFIKIKNAVFQFKPFDYQNNQLLFRPVITINPVIGNQTILDISDSIFISDNLYIFNPQKGFIYYLQLPAKMKPGIKKIFNSINSLALTEIETIKSYFSGIGSNIFQFDFPYKNYKTINIDPEPILEVNELSQGITIKLFFKYGNSTFLYNKEEKIVEIPESGDSLTILPLKSKFHDDIYAAVKKSLGKNLVREKPVPRPTDYTFSAVCTFENFILSSGDDLLAHNVEIRKTGKKVKKTRGLSYKINYQIDWLDVKAGIIDEDGTFKEITFKPELFKTMLLQEKDTFYVISKADIDRLKQLFLLGMTEKGTLKLSKYNSYFISAIYQDIQNKEKNEFTSLKNQSDKLLNFNEIEKTAIPEKFNGKLRLYQKAGLDWLYFLYKYNLNGCLADDMGLGKTVQTLALLQKLKEEAVLSTVLITAPVSTLANWENEIHQFTPELKAYRYHGLNRIKDKKKLKKYDIILISYQTLRNDIEFFLELPITYLILDEAQAIKNPSSQTSRCIKMLNPEHKLSLSGTPIENNTLELWSQFDFLLPGLLGTEKEFITRFSKPIEEQGNRQETELLKKIVFPFILRRKKEDVATDLPDKEEITIFVEMEDEQRKLYDSVKKQIKNKMLLRLDELGVGKSAIEIFTALLRLRQITLFPSMIDSSYEHIPSCKFELLKSFIEEIITENHKVLIFSQFIKTLKIFKSYFDAEKIKYCYLDGSTKNREMEIQQFQENEKIRIFLLSLKAGGKGINLTEADYVILFDPWWNPAIEKQAIDRAYRIGQKKKVIAYKIITKDTIEEKIIELQNKKLELVNNIITEEKAFFKSLTKDDIINLFE